MNPAAPAATRHGSGHREAIKSWGGIEGMTGRKLGIDEKKNSCKKPEWLSMLALIVWSGTKR
jgi:hypothetical protein